MSADQPAAAFNDSSLSADATPTLASSSKTAALGRVRSASSASRGGGGGSDDEGSEVDEDEYTRLASELDQLDSPPGSPDVSTRPASATSGLMGQRPSALALNGAASSVSAPTSAAAPVSSSDSASVSTRASRSGTLDGQSTRIALADVSTALTYYLGRGLSPNENAELRALLEGHGLAEQGVQLDVLTDILQQVKDAVGGGSAAGSRASSQPNSKRSSRDNHAAPAAGAAAVDPIAVFARVLAASGASSAIAPTAPAAPGSNTTSPVQVSAAHTGSARLPRIPAFTPPTRSPQQLRTQPHSSSNGHGHADEDGDGADTGGGLILSPRDSSSPSVLSSTSSSGGADRVALSRLAKENERLMRQMNLLREHNGRTEASLDRALHDLAQAHAQHNRDKDQKDDLAAELARAREERTQALAREKAVQAALEKEQAKRSDLQRAHSALQTRAEIAARAGSKYESALTHARRHSQAEVEGAARLAREQADRASARVAAENQALKAQLADLEAQFAAFAAAQQQQQQLQQQQHEEDAGALSPSAFSPDFVRARHLSSQQLRAEQSSVDFAAGAAVGSGTAAALFQYLQTIQSQHHQRAGSAGSVGSASSSASSSLTSSASLNDSAASGFMSPPAKATSAGSLLEASPASLSLSNSLRDDVVIPEEDSHPSAAESSAATPAASASDDAAAVEAASNAIADAVAVVATLDDVAGRVVRDASANTVATASSAAVADAQACASALEKEVTLLRQQLAAVKEQLAAASTSASASAQAAASATAIVQPNVNDAAVQQQPLLPSVAAASELAASVTGAASRLVPRGTAASLRDSAPAPTSSSPSLPASTPQRPPRGLTAQQRKEWIANRSTTGAAATASAASSAVTSPAEASAPASTEESGSPAPPADKSTPRVRTRPGRGSSEESAAGAGSADVAPSAAAMSFAGALAKSSSNNNAAIASPVPHPKKQHARASDATKGLADQSVLLKEAYDRGYEAGVHDTTLRLRHSTPASASTPAVAATPAAISAVLDSSDSTTLFSPAPAPARARAPGPTLSLTPTKSVIAAPTSPLPPSSLAKVSRMGLSLQLQTPVTFASFSPNPAAPAVTAGADWGALDAEELIPPEPLSPLSVLHRRSADMEAAARQRHQQQPRQQDGGAGQQEKSNNKKQSNLRTPGKLRDIHSKDRVAKGVTYAEDHPELAVAVQAPAAVLQASPPVHRKKKTSASSSSSSASAAAVDAADASSLGAGVGLPAEPIDWATVAELEAAGWDPAAEDEAATMAIPITAATPNKKKKSKKQRAESNHADAEESAEAAVAAVAASPAPASSSKPSKSKSSRRSNHHTTNPHAAVSIPVPARLAAELRAIVAADSVTDEQREAGEAIKLTSYHCSTPAQCCIL